MANPFQQTTSPFNKKDTSQSTPKINPFIPAPNPFVPKGGGGGGGGTSLPPALAPAPSFIDVAVGTSTPTTTTLPPALQKPVNPFQPNLNLGNLNQGQQQALNRINNNQQLSPVDVKNLQQMTKKAGFASSSGAVGEQEVLNFANNYFNQNQTSTYQTTMNVVSNVEKKKGLEGIQQYFSKKRDIAYAKSIREGGYAGAGTQFAVGTGSSILGTVIFGKNIITRPVETIKSIPGGIKQTAEFVGSGGITRTIKQEPFYALGYATGEVAQAYVPGKIVKAVRTAEAVRINKALTKALGGLEENKVVFKQVEKGKGFVVTGVQEGGGLKRTIVGIGKTTGRISEALVSSTTTGKISYKGLFGRTKEVGYASIGISESGTKVFPKSVKQVGNVQYGIIKGGEYPLVETSTFYKVGTKTPKILKKLEQGVTRVGGKELSFEESLSQTLSGEGVKITKIRTPTTVGVSYNIPKETKGFIRKTGTTKTPLSTTFAEQILGTKQVQVYQKVVIPKVKAPKISASLIETNYPTYVGGSMWNVGTPQQGYGITGGVVNDYYPEQLTKTIRKNALVNNFNYKYVPITGTINIQQPQLKIDTRTGLNIKMNPKIREALYSNSIQDTLLGTKTALALKPLQIQKQIQIQKQVYSPTPYPPSTFTWGFTPNVPYFGGRYKPPKKAYYYSGRTYNTTNKPRQTKYSPSLSSWQLGISANPKTFNYKKQYSGTELRPILYKKESTIPKNYMKNLNKALLGKKSKKRRKK